MTLGTWEILAGLAAAVWAIGTFFVTRRRELAWRRTEFVARESKYLDNDAEMRECTLVLYGKHPVFSVQQFISAAQAETLEGDQRRLFEMFEKHLNFFWRIAYAHVALRTLTRRDLDAFSIYLARICEHESLRTYCLSSGYDEIAAAFRRLESG